MPKAWPFWRERELPDGRQTLEAFQNTERKELQFFVKKNEE